MALVATALAALVLAGSAFASPPTPGTPINCSGTPAKSCTPGQIAVDESSGDIYMIDTLHEVIDRFDAQGNYLSQITGLVTNGSNEDDLAVDNSGGSRQGTLYFASINEKALDAFAPGSAGNGQIWQEAGLTEPCGVGVDAQGNPWTGDYVEGVQERSAVDGSPIGGPVAADHGGGSKAFTCQVVFDAASDLYVKLWNGAIYKYLSGNYTTSAAEIEGSPSYDSAIDTSTGVVYSAVGEYNVKSWDSGGNSFGEFDEGSVPKTVAVDGYHGRVYVSSGGTSELQVFTTSGAASPRPYVRTGGVSGATGTGATVAGTVDPVGVSTTCAVQYVTKAQFEAAGFAGAVSQACAAGVGSGTAEEPVSVGLSGLAAGSEYFYRVVATNANGTTVGSAANFSTGSPKLGVFVTGQGSVSASSGVISACEEAAGVCEGEYTVGTKVTLTATAKPGYVFAGWIGCRHTGAGTCEVTVNAEAEVTAVFLLQGTQGTQGATGATGAIGAAGATGAAGAQGPAGQNGAQGAQGPAGQNGAQGAPGPRGPAGKVTCTVKQKRKKVKVTCTVKASASSASVGWRLTRNGRVYGHGATKADRLRLSLGHLRPGRYALHVQGQKGATRIVIA